MLIVIYDFKMMFVSLYHSNSPLPLCIYMDMKKHNNDELFGSIWTHKMEKKEKEEEDFAQSGTLPFRQGHYYTSNI
jgi:hypothetical protein